MCFYLELELVGVNGRRGGGEAYRSSGLGPQLRRGAQHVARGQRLQGARLRGQQPLAPVVPTYPRPLRLDTTVK
jgi:hypothetical protein